MTTWMHTVGGFYNREKFIREARETMVSRRVAHNIVQNFAWGDIVAVIDWNKGEPQAYAEFSVERLTFQTAVMNRLGKALSAEGGMEWRQGGGLVIRECGSYIDAGGWVLAPRNPLTLAELVARAKAVAAELGLPKLECFLGGTLRAYQRPFSPKPAPPWQRGFFRVGENVRWEVRGPRGRTSREFAGMSGYNVRVTKGRADVPA